MPTMTKFTAAPNGVAAAALVHLESGDVNVFVHAIRIEAPVRNQQSQIHAVVQHVMKEVKGVNKVPEMDREAWQRKFLLPPPQHVV